MVRYIGPVAIEIHDQVLFLPGGSVRRWATTIARKQTRNTKAEAPVNKRTNKFPGNPPVGSLRRMISSEVDHVSTRVLDITTTSKAPYSIFVIKGTKTQYKRDSQGRFGFASDGFALPANNYGRYKKVQRVRGQRANDFLTRGMARTAVQHPSLRGSGLRFF